MSFDLASAADYIRARLADGTLTHEDLALCVREAQISHGLVADGKPGPRTLGVLRPDARDSRKVYPLPELADGRRPTITSGFKTRNPSRPHHDGADLFYRFDPAIDPPDTRVGDGAAARGSDGRPRWFIPAGLKAIAAADGVVVVAGDSPTGHRCWIAHDDGLRTGYFHLRDLVVAVGQRVAAGDELGEVGDNPRDKDAEHLHFEVSPVDRYEPQDPEVWLVGAGYHRPE